MEYCGLHAHQRLRDALVNSDLNNVALVARKGRESTEVGTAIEEVAIERSHPKAGGGSNAEHRFQTDLRRQVVAELPCKFDGIFTSCGVPARVEVGLPTSVAWEIAQGSNILILRGEEEHIDGDLHL